MKKIIIVGYFICINLLMINCKSNNNNLNQGIVTHDNLLLRTKPDIIRGKIISKLKKNDKVILLGKSNRKVKIGKYNSFWYKIKTKNNKIGWSYGAFIKTENEKNLIIVNIKIFKNNQNLAFKLKGTYKSPHTKIIIKNDEDLIYYINFCEGYSPIKAKYIIKGIKLCIYFFKPIQIENNKKVKECIFYILNSDLLFNPGPMNLSCGPIYNAFFKSKRFKPIIKKYNFPFVLGLYNYSDLLISSKNYLYFYPNNKLIVFKYNDINLMHVDIFDYKIKSDKIICMIKSKNSPFYKKLIFKIINKKLKEIHGGVYKLKKIILK